MKAHKLLAAGAFAGALFASPLAWAQGKPVQVVTVDSDDAEDQADAFTGALKSRIRAQAGWALTDASSALGPLLTALKCPPKPDGPCLGRIGDQLKVDRFFWGTMKKSGGGKSVTVELHLWTRGKTDQSASETYSENLKDQNDETLRKIASKLFERLSGATGGAPPPPTAGGTVVLAVHANVADGVVFVDGVEKGKLQRGVASVEVPVGSHEIEVRAEGRIPAKQTVSAAPGGETSVSIDLAAEGPPPPAGPSKPFPWKKVAGFSMMGLGVAAGVIGVVEGVQWLGVQSQNDKDHRDTSYSGVTDFCKDATGKAGPNSAPCKNIQDGQTAATLEFVFFGVGAALIGAGTILILADRGSSSPPAEAPPPQATWRFVPSVGPHGGGAGLVGTF